MTEEELDRLRDGTLDPSYPKPGEVWRHYKGGLYDVVCLAAGSEEGHAVCVVYRGRKCGRYWVRGVVGFLEHVNGTGPPRFEKAGG